MRLYLTNTANVRDFNLIFPGARVKLIGGDNGRVEQEEFVEQVTISPSERAVIDCSYALADQFAIEHRTLSRTMVLGTVDVSDQPVDRSWIESFDMLRRSAELEAERTRLAADFDRPPDKTLILVGEMAGSVLHGGRHQHGRSSMETRMESGHQMSMVWKIIDEASGAVNHDIFWEFKTGERVKIRMINHPLADHIMHHPMHFHGERFLVLSRDGARNDNLMWKDTTLVRSGETVDILLEASNPGLWMAHCHIAEHAEAGMMFNFRVS
jgi:FtsP/CotA-like multicopper oxidase with cupredoxin domain